jgi:O-6-methylguanine DNA methyltransferase
MEITTSEKGVTSITLSRSNRKPGRQTVPEQSGGPAAIFDEARIQLIEYLAGERRVFSLPVDMSNGTPFQRRVWRAILKIPYGRVRSYQWVATRVGGKQYARAVGMALGRNSVPIVVPCHRIIAHDGSLGGFTGGLPMKRMLLKLEGTLGQLEE